MLSKTLAVLATLCFLPVVFCTNECSLLDQLVDVKLQLKDMRQKEAELRHKFQSSEEDNKIMMGDTQKTITNIQQTLSDELAKGVRRDKEMHILQEQFQNLTTRVTMRWDEMGQALVVMENDLKQNITSLKSLIRQGNWENNMTIGQIEQSMQESINDFVNHVKSVHQEVANVSKAQLSSKSKCIGYNYNYLAKFNLCYRLGYDEGNTWRDHRKICLAQYGDLVTLESSDMLKWLQDLIKISPVVRNLRTFHIDGNDEGSEGVWVNKYGEPLWTKWAPGQPNSYNSGDPGDQDGGQHCNSLHKSNDLMMNDCSCEHNYSKETGYICQIKV